MTAYEICIVSILGFVALLFLIFVIVTVKVLLSLEAKSSEIMSDLAHKLEDLDPAFHLMNRFGSRVDEQVEELCDQEEHPKWVDMVTQLASLAVVGAGMWQNYRKKRRR